MRYALRRKSCVLTVRVSPTRIPICFLPSTFSANPSTTYNTHAIGFLTPIGLPTCNFTVFTFTITFYQNVFHYAHYHFHYAHQFACQFVSQNAFKYVLVYVHQPVCYNVSKYALLSVNKYVHIHVFEYGINYTL